MAKCALNPLDSSVCFADPKNTVPCSIFCEGGSEELVQIATRSDINLLESGEHISQFFRYEHLKPEMQAVSRHFALLAGAIVKLPRSPERTVALRKLLESKDAAVRALIAKP